MGISAGLMALIAVLLAAFFTIRSLREEMIEGARDKTLQVSETLLRSMRHSMIRNDVQAIEGILQTVGQQKGVFVLRILNKAGEVRFSANPQEIGDRVDKSSGSCAACHASMSPRLSLTPADRIRTFSSPEGQQILRMITPIYSEPTCSAYPCHAHGPEDRVLGVMDIGISLEETNRAVAHAINKTVFFSVLLFAGITALLGIGLMHFVARPVRKMTQATHRLSKGEYGHELAIRTNDELGQLAQAFNRMTREVQQREEELVRKRNELQGLFESVPTSIAVVDRDLRIVRTNQNFKDTFGDHLGISCCSAYKGIGASCMMDCPVRQTFADQRLHRCEELGITKEGEIIQYFVYTAPVLNSEGQVEYVVRSAVDLRETKRLEKELRASQDFLDKLIDHSIHGIVALDAEGQIIIFNRSAERILGYRADGVLGQKDPKRFFPQEFVRMIESSRSGPEMAGNGKMVAQETWVRSESGERIPVRFSGVILKEDGLAAGAVGFFQDLRGFKALEEEKRQADRLALVGQTVATLAHEIKNILNGLEGGVYVTQSAMRRQDETLLQTGWGMVKRNIEKISHLVKDLLSFSKLRSSERKWLSPNELAEDAGSLFEEKARQLGIDLVMDLEPDLDEVFLDPKTTHACLTNLLSNAIDACEEDTAKERHRIVLRTRRAQDDGVTFEVQDDGKGMDEAVTKRIFANFFTSKGGRGTGLGLMVTQQIVHEQGGRISFETEPGKGSVFRVVLPRAQVTTGDAESVSALSD